MKGHRDEKSVRIYLALAAAFSTSPIESNFFKGDLTHKERGPVDEKISTEKKRGFYHDLCVFLQPKGQKDTGGYNNCFIFLARSFHTRAWDKQISRFVSFTERERERERESLCFEDRRALPSFVVVGINRSVRARARELRKERVLFKRKLKHVRYE